MGRQTDDADIPVSMETLAISDTSLISDQITPSEGVQKRFTAKVG